MYDTPRTHKRFEVALPVSVSPASGTAAWAPYTGTTRDVSAGGLYLHTGVGHAVGEELALSLFIAVRRIGSSPVEGGARIDVRGVVVRSDDEGVAVEFSEPYQMWHVPDVDFVARTRRAPRAPAESPAETADADRTEGPRRGSLG